MCSRAGRFGTKGLAITFLSSESDQQVMSAIQSRFEVAVPELPDHIDPDTYSKCSIVVAKTDADGALCSSDRLNVSILLFLFSFSLFDVPRVC